MVSSSHSRNSSAIALLSACSPRLSKFAICSTAQSWECLKHSSKFFLPDIFLAISPEEVSHFPWARLVVKGLRFNSPFQRTR